MDDVKDSWKGKVKHGGGMLWWPVLVVSLTISGIGSLIVSGISKSPSSWAYLRGDFFFLIASFEVRRPILNLATPSGGSPHKRTREKEDFVFWLFYLIYRQVHLSWHWDMPLQELGAKTVENSTKMVWTTIGFLDYPSKMIIFGLVRP